MPHSFTIGRWHRDGKTGKWTKRKSNRKKDWWEFEGRTKAQREKDRKARQKRSEELGKARTKAAQEKAEAKKKARYEKDKARAARDQAFRARAEDRSGPAPTVTQTGARAWGHSGTQAREYEVTQPGVGTWTRVVRGEVVTQTLTEIEAASLCGAPNKTGGRCMRSVAPGSRCPVHRTGSKPATSPRSGAGVR